MTDAKLLLIILIIGFGNKYEQSRNVLVPGICGLADSHIVFLHMQKINMRLKLSISLYCGEKYLPHALVIKAACELPHHHFIPSQAPHTHTQATVPAGRQLTAQCRINWYQYAGL